MTNKHTNAEDLQHFSWPSPLTLWPLISWFRSTNWLTKPSSVPQRLILNSSKIFPFWKSTAQVVVCVSMRFLRSAQSKSCCQTTKTGIGSDKGILKDYNAILCWKEMHWRRYLEWWWPEQQNHWTIFFLFQPCAIKKDIRTALFYVWLTKKSSARFQVWPYELVVIGIWLI